MTIEYPKAEDGFRHAGFYRNPEQIKVLGDPEIKLPSKLYDELIMQGKSPSDTAKSVIQIGILADRGVLVQPLGNEELTVTVAEVDNYPIGTRINHQTKTSEPDVKSALYLSNNVAVFIAQTSKLFPGEATREQLNLWFIKALRIWQVFNDTDLMHFRIDQDTIKPLNSQGIEETWNALNFPKPVIEDFPSLGKSIKTLYFKEMYKPLDFHPAHD